jgi:ABC-type polysaccharide/polyol phosphate transport system ATPase subunit
MKRIIVENLNKEFKLNRRGSETVLGRAVGFLSRVEPKKMRIADHISFEVEAGENIGIIGANGSGKSSLLRLIAGIYTEDSGHIRTNGSLVYLAGFGQGLQSLLSMRENIYLIGTMMGLSTREIGERFDEIVQFSGLAEFVDAKIYQFSSGMLTRLNFSVMIFCVKHNNPDILLFDEIFSAGGDIDFQTRALAKMEELIHSGATVVLVSHEMETVKRYCDRAIWLENGKIVQIGPAEKIVDAYLADKSAA